jgi:hypothetical protein
VRNVTHIVQPRLVLRPQDGHPRQPAWVHLASIVLRLFLLVFRFLFCLRCPLVALLGELRVLGFELLLAGLAGTTASNPMSNVGQIALKSRRNAPTLDRHLSSSAVTGRHRNSTDGRAPGTSSYGRTDETRQTRILLTFRYPCVLRGG